MQMKELFSFLFFFSSFIVFTRTALYVWHYSIMTLRSLSSERRESINTFTKRGGCVVLKKMCAVQRENFLLTRKTSHKNCE